MKRLKFTFLSLVLAFGGVNYAFASIVSNVNYEDLPGGSYFQANYNLDLNTPLYYYTCPYDGVFPNVTLNYESGSGYNAPLADSTNYGGCYREYFQGSFEYYNEVYSTWISADKLGDANGHFVDMGNVGTCGNFYMIPDPYLTYDPWIGIYGVHNYVERLPAQYPIYIYKFHTGNTLTGWFVDYNTQVNISSATTSGNSVIVSGSYTYGLNASSTMDAYNQLIFSFYDNNSNLVVGTHTINFDSATYGKTPFSITKKFNLTDAGATGALLISAYFKNSKTASTSENLGCASATIYGETATTTIPAFSCNPFSGDITTLFLNTDFSISGCFGDLMSWLFTPSTTVMEQFTGIKDLIANKPPFGYFAMIKTSLDVLSATGTATTSVDNIVIPTYIKNSIFDPIKTGVSVLIWFLVLVFLFNRIKHIQL